MILSAKPLQYSTMKDDGSALRVFFSVTHPDCPEKPEFVCLVALF
jgi:hypothetical protein